MRKQDLIDSSSGKPAVSKKQIQIPQKLSEDSPEAVMRGSTLIRETSDFEASVQLLFSRNMVTLGITLFPFPGGS